MTFNAMDVGDELQAGEDSWYSCADLESNICFERHYSSRMAYGRLEAGSEALGTRLTESRPLLGSVICRNLDS
jgi:hypothetical protein